MHNIYIDGSCLGNGQPGAVGGWGFVIYDNNHCKTHEDLGKLPGEEKQTNNRAELYALIQALQWVKKHPEIKACIKSDSKIVIDGLKGSAIRKANRDLWAPIESLCKELNGRITAEHVYRDKNKEADALARQGANALITL